MNLDISSKFWGNLEGIWGNPGEIPHVGWKIRGVERVKTSHIYHFLELLILSAILGHFLFATALFYFSGTADHLQQFTYVSYIELTKFAI